YSLHGAPTLETDTPSLHDALPIWFTREETTQLLNQVMKLDLSAPEIAALDDRTEGWIAGLQLAALSIKDHQDRSEFISAFTGSQDRKSTRLNSSHVKISYAVFCLK